MTRKANSYQLRALRSRVCGAMATPSAPVVPVHIALPSGCTIDTRAPGTLAALSRRVTQISVFCGLSLTLIARLVTWTRLARVIGWVSRVREPRDRSIGVPSSTAAHARPVPFGLRTFDRSRPCDCTRSGVTLNRRSAPAPDGESRNSDACSLTSVDMRFCGSTGATHWRMPVKLRA